MYTLEQMNTKRTEFLNNFNAGSELFIRGTEVAILFPEIISITSTGFAAIEKATEHYYDLLCNPNYQMRVNTYKVIFPVLFKDNTWIVCNIVDDQDHVTINIYDPLKILPFGSNISIQKSFSKKNPGTNPICVIHPGKFTEELLKTITENNSELAFNILSLLFLEQNVDMEFKDFFYEKLKGVVSTMPIGSLLFTAQPASSIHVETSMHNISTGYTNEQMHKLRTAFLASEIFDENPLKIIDKHKYLLLLGEVINFRGPTAIAVATKHNLNCLLEYKLALTNKQNYSAKILFPVEIKSNIWAACSIFIENTNVNIGIYDPSGSLDQDHEEQTKKILHNYYKQFKLTFDINKGNINPSLLQKTSSKSLSGHLAFDAIVILCSGRKLSEIHGKDFSKLSDDYLKNMLESQKAILDNKNLNVNPSYYYDESDIAKATRVLVSSSSSYQINQLGMVCSKSNPNNPCIINTKSIAISEPLLSLGSDADMTAKMQIFVERVKNLINKSTDTNQHLILLPFSVNQNHWSVLAIEFENVNSKIHSLIVKVADAFYVHRDQQQIATYSKGVCERIFAAFVEHKLIDISIFQQHVSFIPIAPQLDTTSCGVIAAEVISNLILGLPISVNENEYAIDSVIELRAKHMNLLDPDFRRKQREDLPNVSLTAKPAIEQTSISNITNYITSLDDEDLREYFLIIAKKFAVAELLIEACNQEDAIKQATEKEITLLGGGQYYAGIDENSTQHQYRLANVDIKEWFVNASTDLAIAIKNELFKNELDSDGELIWKAGAMQIFVTAICEYQRSVNNLALADVKRLKLSA